MKRALYFGCLNKMGHYLHVNGSRHIDARVVAGLPWDIGHMDGGLLKNGKRRDLYDGQVFWTCGGRDVFWYAFYWWDRSVDKRGASNSGFYVSGFRPDVLTPETANENARLAFDYACAEHPAVVQRQHHPLVLQMRPPDDPGAQARAEGCTVTRQEHSPANDGREKS
jgi:hypothetical protein